ncbi:uncharacterized protein CMU_001460 [Cryptosporidium muris RN66]|uniref:Potassium channel domain-containing protein n=1 Tax=Cryptosporidium muris (strain RN66) TaxID=441375 RepID=B6AGD4_CRYMR|nr:uncharacterized protein CMU_001460 [Cryptosporidium muris RN66]EEA07275.1 hypothetical protein, conserved [Cryptosporidium muris RN66]|eukprot:XP_002141624.1 hypothetical protein [Cryptosporidium muris RN66]
MGSYSLSLIACILISYSIAIIVCHGLLFPNITALYSLLIFLGLYLSTLIFVGICHELSRPYMAIRKIRRIIICVKRRFRKYRRRRHTKAHRILPSIKYNNQPLKTTDSILSNLESTEKYEADFSKERYSIKIVDMEEGNNNVLKRREQVINNLNSVKFKDTINPESKHEKSTIHLQDKESSQSQPGKIDNLVPDNGINNSIFSDNMNNDFVSRDMNEGVIEFSHLTNLGGFKFRNTGNSKNLVSYKVTEPSLEVTHKVIKSNNNIENKQETIKIMSKYPKEDLSWVDYLKYKISLLKVFSFFSTKKDTFKSVDFVSTDLDEQKPISTLQYLVKLVSDLHSRIVRKFDKIFVRYASRHLSVNLSIVVVFMINLTWALLWTADTQYLYRQSPFEEWKLRSDSLHIELIEQSFLWFADILLFFKAIIETSHHRRGLRRLFSFKCILSSEIFAPLFELVTTSPFLIIIKTATGWSATTTLYTLGFLRYFRLLNIKPVLDIILYWSSEIMRIGFVIVWTILIVLVGFSGAIMIIESPYPNFTTLFDYFYFTIITIATVGYGDFAPHYFLSRFICIVLILFTLIYIPNQISNLVQLTQAPPDTLGGGMIASYQNGLFDKEHVQTLLILVCGSPSVKHLSYLILELDTLATAQNENKEFRDSKDPIRHQPLVILFTTDDLRRYGSLVKKCEQSFNTQLYVKRLRDFETLREDLEKVKGIVEALYIWSDSITPCPSERYKSEFFSQIDAESNFLRCIQNIQVSVSDAFLKDKLTIMRWYAIRKFLTSPSYEEYGYKKKPLKENKLSFFESKSSHIKLKKSQFYPVLLFNVKIEDYQQETYISHSNFVNIKTANFLRGSMLINRPLLQAPSNPEDIKKYLKFLSTLARSQSNPEVLDLYKPTMASSYIPVYVSEVRSRLLAKSALCPGFSSLACNMYHAINLVDDESCQESLLTSLKNSLEQYGTNIQNELYYDSDFELDEYEEEDTERSGLSPVELLTHDYLQGSSAELLEVAVPVYLSQMQFMQVSAFLFREFSIYCIGITVQINEETSINILDNNENEEETGESSLVLSDGYISTEEDFHFTLDISNSFKDSESSLQNENVIDTTRRKVLFNPYDYIFGESYVCGDILINAESNVCLLVLSKSRQVEKIFNQEVPTIRKYKNPIQFQLNQTLNYLGICQHSKCNKFLDVPSWKVKISKLHSGKKSTQEDMSPSNKSINKNLTNEDHTSTKYATAHISFSDNNERSEYTISNLDSNMNKINSSSEELSKPLEKCTEKFYTDNLNKRNITRGVPPMPTPRFDIFSVYSLIKTTDMVRPSEIDGYIYGTTFVLLVCGWPECISEFLEGIVANRKIPVGWDSLRYHRHMETSLPIINKSLILATLIIFLSPIASDIYLEKPIIPPGCRGLYVEGSCCKDEDLIRSGLFYAHSIVVCASGNQVNNTNDLQVNNDGQVVETCWKVASLINMKIQAEVALLINKKSNSQDKYINSRHNLQLYDKVPERSNQRNINENDIYSFDFKAPTRVNMKVQRLKPLDIKWNTWQWKITTNLAQLAQKWLFFGGHLPPCFFPAIIADIRNEESLILLDKTPWIYSSNWDYLTSPVIVAGKVLTTDMIVPVLYRSIKISPLVATADTLQCLLGYNSSDQERSLRYIKEESEEQSSEYIEWGSVELISVPAQVHGKSFFRLFSSLLYSSGAIPIGIMRSLGNSMDIPNIPDENIFISRPGLSHTPKFDMQNRVVLLAPHPKMRVFKYDFVYIITPIMRVS